MPAHAADLAPWQGATAPPLALTDLDGRKHDLSAYRGKVVLVKFWATWCGPCRAELPSMKRLRDRLIHAPFAVLAVNVDEPEARIRRFLETTPLDFVVLPDPGGRTARAWNVRILPSSFLIGRDGAIRYSVRGDVDWSSDAVAAIVDKLIR
jgi:peroxiredoxin